MSSQLNVIVIVADTARAEAVTQDTAAVLDSLDIEGGRFATATAAAPWTLPSHASLFTGTYPSYHGAHAGHKQLSDSTLTVQQQFSEAGYETVAVSNNTWISGEFGFNQGFDTFRKNWQYVQSDVDLGEIARTEEGLSKLTTVARRLFDGNPIVNVANAVYGQFVRSRADDDGAQRMNEWIDDWLTSRDDTSPFFLFVNYLEPHLEYRPPREYAEQFLPEGVTYEQAMDVNQDAWSYIAGNVEMTDRDFEILRALYRAEIAYLDEKIGQLREMLRAAGEWEDTVFLVTGDHGENIGEHGLMDHQYSLHDTLLRVPLVIEGGPFNDSGEIDDLVQLTDIAPTLLDVAGIDAPEFRDQAQGQSFHPDSDSPPREFAVAEYLAPQPSMEALEKRVGELSASVRKYDRSLRTIRTREWKLIRGSDGSKRLFNVADDPDELRDRAEEQPEKVAELESKLDDWLDSFEHATGQSDVEMDPETKERLEDLGYIQ